MTSTEFDQIYLKTFNAQQIEAVHSVDGAVLLLAVPGSGKTTVLVTRLGYMIHCHSIPAQRILTMTYTVAATVEMRQRFVDLFGKFRYVYIQKLANFLSVLRVASLNGTIF